MDIAWHRRQRKQSVSAAAAPDRPEWTSADRRDLAHVARVAIEWVEACDSPLYVHLALECARDQHMLALIARIDNVPPLNLLFGAVKLALEADDPLAQWYPHLAGDDTRPVDDEAYPAFRSFALDREDWIVEVGRTRRTQTNEVGRAAAILPWLASEASRITAQAGLPLDSPVHLVDVGASAGLNLCLDRFDYDYSGARLEARAPASSRVTLHCENRGDFALPGASPVVGDRWGLDLEPLDATNPADAAWLEALVWPEHRDRLERLRAALAIRHETDVSMIAGDATQTLAELDAQLPPGPVLVFHTVMAYQLDGAQRRALDDAIADLARDRLVARVALEPLGITKRPEVRVGLRLDEADVVARAHAHGRWLERV
jgi:hypothetical protein